MRANKMAGIDGLERHDAIAAPIAIKVLTIQFGIDQGKIGQDTLAVVVALKACNLDPVRLVGRRSFVRQGKERQGSVDGGIVGRLNGVAPSAEGGMCQLFSRG